MALTASSLITAAKKGTFGATGRQRISDALLLEELTYQDNLIVQMFSQIAPDLLATVTGTVVLTDAGNTNGYTLDDGIHYRDFVHVDSNNDTYTPIEIVQRQYQHGNISAPAAMLRSALAAAVLYPIDPQGTRWQTSGARNWFEPTSNHTVSYSYIAAPAVVATLSATLASPDMARSFLVTSLRLAIMLSDGTASETQLSAALAARQTMLESLRMQIYKYINPQGSKPMGRALSDSEWVDQQIGG